MYEYDGVSFDEAFLISVKECQPLPTSLSHTLAIQDGGQMFTIDMMNVQVR